MPKAKAKRGMDAVISKTNDTGRPRKPLLQRKGKGPGIAIMIAVGKPKPGQDDDNLGEELDASKGAGMPKAKKIAALEEKIAYLKAELALLRNEDDEMGDDMDTEDDDSDDDE